MRSRMRRLKTLPVLPTLLTAGNLSSGITAILCAAHNMLEAGAFMVFVAMICDMLDGKVARLTKTDGPFGAELDSLSEALNEVRGRALVRLAEEARHVGADAVVGVQTRAGESQLDTGTLALEHVVVGTAVRREGAQGKQPVLTELSVAEYAMLLQGGFEPLGIVAHSAVFFTSYVFGGMMAGGGALTMGVQSFELREFTQAIYSAREAAMQQIAGQARALGAAGVVGMQIGHTVRPHTLSGGLGMGGGFAGGGQMTGLMVTFSAVGTAIGQHDKHTVQAPKPVVDLST